MNARDQLAKCLCDWEDLYDWATLGDRSAYYQEADRILREIVQPIVKEAYETGACDHLGCETTNEGEDYAARVIADLAATREGDNG